MASVILSTAQEVERLAVLNQNLIARSLDLGLVFDAKYLDLIDYRLKSIIESRAGYRDLISKINAGVTLLVGEGNLSFALSLANNSMIQASKLVASTFEKFSDYSDFTIQNYEELKLLGVDVVDEINATNLVSSFERNKFDNIVFQFPNVGSREPLEGRNPNFVLVRDFLISAKSIIKNNGKLFVTIVDTPYYEGLFALQEASEIAGYKIIDQMPFYPEDYDGYQHTMTNSEDSGIEEYNSFITLIFMPL